MVGAEPGLEAACALALDPLGTVKEGSMSSLSVLEISELGVSWMLSKSASHCGPWATGGPEPGLEPRAPDPQSCLFPGGSCVLSPGSLLVWLSLGLRGTGSAG